MFKVLMQELYLTFHAKQFELIKRSPSKPILHNKSLSASRSKMLGDALENVENWVGNGIGSSFKRKKAYNYNYGALQLHEVELPKEHRTFMESIQKLVIR